VHAALTPFHVAVQVRDIPEARKFYGRRLGFPQWESFADRVSRVIDRFVIEPCIRFKGQPGEQGTMFFLDPSGNALEFKAFRDIGSQLFAR